MTIPSSNSETYPGRDLSLSQLLHATKSKLHDIVFSGIITTTLGYAEVLQDTSEIHRLLLSLRNSFAPVNRIPPEVLSLIPDYCGQDDLDQDLIKLTHVCRGWRDTFTSRSSLWTKLYFTDIDKTRTYIQRSQSSPMQIYLIDDQHTSYLDDAVSLVIPHIHRLKSLTVRTDVLPDIFSHLYCPTPLLEELDICLRCYPTPIIDSALFDDDLSSLRKLHLGQGITHLPWKTLTNLRDLSLFSCPPGHEVTQLLDFFESAPLLHTVVLINSIPSASDAPPDRILHLRHLNTLHIISDLPPSTLLKHLYIPTGTSLYLEFPSRGGESPLLDYLPERSPNLRNITHVTSVNLLFHWREKCMRLNGSSGNLRLTVHWENSPDDWHTIDRRIVHSIRPSILSTTQKLSFSRYEPPSRDEPGECPVSQALYSATVLRTLVLTECSNLPFILALDPEENHSEFIPCPNLDRLVIYIRYQDEFHTEHLIRMAEHRARRGARLSWVKIVSLDEPVPEREVLRLKDHVGHLEYRFEDIPFPWDHLPREDDGESNQACVNGRHPSSLAL